MEPQNVTFSIDLVEAALRHMNFLDRVSAIQNTFTDTVLQHALRRYEQLWLPLADESRSHGLVAPIDIEWMWYIHLLSPLAYRRDCRKTLGKGLEHEFPAENKIVSRTNTAIELWYNKYSLDGFNIIRNGEYSRPVRNKGILQDKPSKLSIDLIANSGHHIHFCYQIALPHFRDKKYLESAVKRYKQFLCLKREEPGEFLTPSVDIMLIWFTHMCHPIAYARDLLSNVGQVLDNNVKVRPTLVTERFLAARQKTNALWQRMASTNLMQPGSKLRSNTHSRQLAWMTQDDLISCCDVIYRVHITHAELTAKPKKLRKFDVRLSLTGTEEQDTSDVATLEGPRRMWGLSASFHYNSSDHRPLLVQLFRNSRMWCMVGDSSAASGSFNLSKYLKDMGGTDKPLSIEIDLQEDLKVLLDGPVPTAIPTLCNLVLEKGEFEKKTLTVKELRRMIGSFPIPGHVTTGDQTCFVSMSRLLNQLDVECFRCRVVHIPELLCSGVQVFYGNKLVVTSDVIGSSHLPSSTQLESADLSITFDPELGERAMLIRNSKGDWGLCVARWLQDRPPGYLEVRFMKLAGMKKLVTLDLTSVELEFQSFTTNLYTGEIFVNPASNTVAENLALIWSISVLYVLCSPTKLNRELSFTGPVREAFTSKADLNADESQANAVVVAEAHCEILLAAGLGTNVPSNAYIINKFGSLNYDINLDAQDMVVEEQILDKKLFRKESKELKSDFVDSPRKSRKKKRKLKFRENADNLGLTDDSMHTDRSRTDKEERTPEKTIPKANQVAPLQGNTDDEKDVTAKKEVAKKRKRLRKKKTSGLDDMLCMSDDSITKDDVEVKKLVKDKQGKTIAVPKTSNLAEDLIPSDDSIDKEEREKHEFLQAVAKDDTKENSDRKGSLVVENIEMVREETSMIRELAEKKKQRNTDGASRPSTANDEPPADNTATEEQQIDNGHSRVSEKEAGKQHGNGKDEMLYLDGNRNDIPTTVET